MAEVVTEGSGELPGVAGAVPDETRGVALGSLLMTSMIWALNASRRPWISESGTSSRVRPYSAICCQSSLSFVMPSALSGPSRVRTSWLARA